MKDGKFFSFSTSSSDSQAIMDQELLEKIAAVVAAHSPVSSGGVVAGSSSLATDGHASASHGAAPSSAAAGEDHTADDYLSVAFTPAKKIFRVSTGVQSLLADTAFFTSSTV